MAFQTWYTSTIALPVWAADTTIEVAVAPVATAWRMKIGRWTTVEWISYSWVSGTTLTGVVRWLSKTADPATAGTGQSWLAWTQIKLVAMHDQLFDKYNWGTIGGNIAFSGNVSVWWKLSFTGTDTVWLNIKTLTTTQRNALTPAVWDKIINSTTGTEQTYYGWTWNDAGTNATANATTTVAGKVSIADATAVTNWTDANANGSTNTITPSQLKSVKDTLNTSIGNISANSLLVSQYVWEDIVAGNTVFFENNSTIKYNNSVTDATWATYWNTFTWSASTWRKITASKDITINVVNKTGACGATRCLIKNSWGTTLATASFVGNTAVFSTPYFLASGTTFRVEVDDNWSNYAQDWTVSTISPVVWTNITYVTWSNNWADTNIGSTLVNIVSNSNNISIANLWNTTANTRISFLQYGSWTAFSSLSLLLNKVLSPSVSVLVRLETDNAWSPSGTLLSANAFWSVTAASLTTTNTLTSISLAGSVTATIGSKFRVVVCPWTYWSETINASNYFQVWYINEHTTTRFEKLYNGSAYQATTNKFFYISCSGSINSLVSKTSASYIYKSSWIWIARNWLNAWTSNTLQIEASGITLNASTGTVGQDLFLSNTAGTLSTTAWTYQSYFGTYIDTDKVYMQYKSMQTPISISNNTVYYAISNGLVCVTPTSGSVTWYTDVTTSPTTIVIAWSSPITFPVQKWYYYKVNCSGWITYGTFTPLV